VNGGAAGSATDDPAAGGPPTLASGRTAAALLPAAATIVGVVGLALAVAHILPLDPAEPHPPTSDGATWSVAAEGGDFSRIGAALDAAEEGDTILIESGVYEEALIIDKDVTLKGNVVPPHQAVLVVPVDAPDPVVPLPPSDPSVEPLQLPERVPVGIQVIEADATLQDLVVIGRSNGIAVLVHGGAPTLEGLTLKHEDVPESGTSLAGGLFIEGASTASVRDAEIWYGVRIGGDSAPTISASTFSRPLLLIQDGATPALDDNVVTGDCGHETTIVVGGAHPTLTSNSFINAGLHVVGHGADATSATIKGNRFSSSLAVGVALADAAMVVVEGNKFYGNQVGVRVTAASADIRDNDFVDNWTSVQLQDTDATLAGNTIRGGGYAVTITSSGSPLIGDNLIEKPELRGIIVGDHTSPTIDGNSVCGSEDNLVVAAMGEPTIGDNDICPDKA
jgi:hypothetical protein